MSERPDIEVHQQTALGDDGQIELTESSIETSLEDFGADVDHRERDSFCRQTTNQYQPATTRPRT